MRLRSINCQNFRNLRHLCLSPDDGVNVVRGENAQGKTNLIEAIWLLSGSQSFRGARDAELIRFGETSCRVEAGFWSAGRMQEVSLQLAPKKAVTLNGVAREGASSLCGELPMVVFSPAHLTLVRGGPAERRRFLDEAIAPLFPSYEGNLSYYARTLKQRNSLLRDIPQHPALLEMLGVWDQSLARAGAQIIRLRQRYVSLLRERAGAVYAGISQGRETLELRYTTTIEGLGEDCDIAGVRAAFLQALEHSRGEDLRQSTTTVGAHRDDLVLTLDGQPARQFGSQGQQRSCVLALKMAECGIIEETAGKKPVVLLDDVLSELDHLRRDFLLSQITDRQVFITCCDEETAPAGAGKTFILRDGELV